MTILARAILRSLFDLSGIRYAIHFLRDSASFNLEIFSVFYIILPTILCVYMYVSISSSSAAENRYESAALNSEYISELEENSVIFIICDDFLISNIDKRKVSYLSNEILF